MTASCNLCDRKLSPAHMQTHTRTDTSWSCCKHQDREIFCVLFSCKCKRATNCIKVSRKSGVRSLNSVIYVAKNSNNQLKKKQLKVSAVKPDTGMPTAVRNRFSPQLIHSFQISRQITWHSIYWCLKESASEIAAFPLSMVRCPIS